MPEAAPQLDERDTEAAETASPRVSGSMERWLLRVVGLVVLVFVAAGVSLAFYVLSMRDAPRTAVERLLSTDETAAREHPEDIENWARLALSYAEAKRWDDAERAIAQGRRIRSAAILDLTEADILRLKGDRRAVAAYDRALASAQAESERNAKDLKEKKGVVLPGTAPIVYEALFGKARALDSSGDTAGAIDAARRAAQMQPTDADLRVALGGMLLKAGRKQEARVEFETALRFVPDLKAARDGLAKAGE